MIRRLRRAHLIAIVVAGPATVVAAGLALGSRTEVGPAALPVPLQPARRSGPTIAAIAWPVDADTLYLEWTAASADSAGPEARFSVSAGTRWPDAVVYWSGRETEATLPTDATPLGIVAAGHDLVVRLPGPGGTLHLYSVAWDRHLGAWALPRPTARQ